MILRESARVGKLLAALWLGACGSSAPVPVPVPPRVPAPAPAPTFREVSYDVSVDAALSRLQVRVCFVGQAPTQLHCTAAEGARSLGEARLLAPTQRALNHDAHHVFLKDVPDDACVGYTVGLGDAARSLSHDDARREAVWLSSGEWLWRPAGRLDGVRLRARFQLPEGVSLSVPWPVNDAGEHALDATVFAFKSFIALGALEREQIARPDGVLDVAILPGLSPQTRAAVRPWLEAQAEAVAQGGAGFPVPRVQVLVVPTEGASEPVHFGTTFRGGGASLALFVGRDAQQEPLRQDWVALHELCHLRLPFLARRDAWLSEGVATYHQEVLRVRAGLLDPAVAWGRLYQGARLRYGADQSLEHESEQMPWKHNYPLVYWSGAAFALLADVALREQSAGKQSLDTVLGEVTRCCAVTEQAWTAERLLQRMDAIAGTPLFEPLYRREVVGPGLPGLDALYARLGLVVRDGVAEPVPSAELGWLRDAIMSPRNR